ERARPKLAPGWLRREPSLPEAAEVAYGRTLSQLTRLNVPAVHDSGYIGTGVKICFLDDGFNYYRTHEALKRIRVDSTYDFIRGPRTARDPAQNPPLFPPGTSPLSGAAGTAPGSYTGPAFDCTAILGRTEDDGSEKPIEMVYWAMGAEWADALG